MEYDYPKTKSDLERENAELRALCDELALALEFYKKENDTAVECGLLEPDIIMPAAQALAKYESWMNNND